MTATTTSSNHQVSQGRFEELAAEIRQRHRAILREFTIHEEDGGAVLHGYAYSYYGKQMALHEVQRANLAVIANRIIVGESNWGHNISLRSISPSRSS